MSSLSFSTEPAKMIEFYYHPSPNPLKVALFLEEAGLPYELIPIDTRKGEQFTPEFLAINPNAKTPAITDGDVTVFDSNAILMYLAEKSGQFLPENTLTMRGQMLSWMMFIASGIGPYSGQAAHFVHMAPTPKPQEYAVTRYLFEADRHWGIIEAHLAQNKFMLGDTYTLVDISLWGWARAVPFIFGADGFAKYTHLKAWFDGINARPAAGRAEALKNKHTYKMEMDEEAQGYWFPHTKLQAA
jgi:GSH-dependent disulfide-bond oxidoreductase